MEMMSSLSFTASTLVLAHSFQTCVRFMRRGRAGIQYISSKAPPFARYFWLDFSSSPTSSSFLVRPLVTQAVD